MSAAGIWWTAIPIIMIHSVDPNRKLSFYNPVSSVVATPEFTPDGKHVLFGTKIGSDKDEKIYMANLQGGDSERRSRMLPPSRRSPR